MPGPIPNPDDDPDVFEVEAIRGRRYKGKKRSKITEYLVKWKGYPETDTLWQRADTIGTAADLLAAYEAGTRRRKVLR